MYLILKDSYLNNSPKGWEDRKKNDICIFGGGGMMQNVWRHE